MNLFIRSTLFIARLAFTIFIKLIVLLIRLLWPLLVALLRILRSLMSMSFAAAADDPEIYIERLASEWTRKLLDSGVSLEHLDYVHSLCRFLATSTIVLGWVVTALISVAILRVVYGYLF